MFARYCVHKNRVDSQTAGWTTQNMMLRLFCFSLRSTEEQLWTNQFHLGYLGFNQHNTYWETM